MESRPSSAYFGVGLHSVKNPINVGAVLRAVGCFGGAFVATSGNRYRHAITDTGRVSKQIPLFQVESLHAAIPFDCVPLAVEFVEGAAPLDTFEHPRRAFYVFGAEDQTLGASVLGWCRDTIVIPSQGCLNLSAAVNIVLYDRAAKLRRQGIRATA